MTKRELRKKFKTAARSQVQSYLDAMGGKINGHEITSYETDLIYDLAIDLETAYNQGYDAGFNAGTTPALRTKKRR